jgi:uncharacterized protein
MPDATPNKPTKKPGARGFAAMTPERQRELASKGGKTAHARGTAYEWTAEQAREAGRTGGLSVSANAEHMRTIGRAGGVKRGERYRESKDYYEGGGMHRPKA